jgi:hypothetical protein
MVKPENQQPRVPVLVEVPDPEGRRWGQALELLLDAAVRGERRQER